MAYDPELDESPEGGRGGDARSRRLADGPAFDGRQIYEVFAQFGAGRPVTHLGSVRAGDRELAWHAAKEAYTRREDCSLLWVVPRRAITSSTEEDEIALKTGSRFGFRHPAYPSGHRRARTTPPPDSRPNAR